MARRLFVVVAAVTLTGLVAAPADAKPRRGEDRLFNVLAPGQFGGLPTNANSTDQIPLYDGLTPLVDHVTAADIPKYFKPETFGSPDDPGHVEPTPRPGLRLVRDSFGVPHIFGKTRADVEFGAGWATAQDRALLLEVIRGPARIAALDVPGLDAFSIAASLQQFVPSEQTEQFLATQETLIANEGPKGRQILADVDNYIAGINAQYAASGNTARPWTRLDVLASTTLIGAIFGKGGGDEVRRSELLSALRARLGQTAGSAVFRDLREVNDPEAPTTISTPFPYATAPTGPTPGSLAVDAGSIRDTSALTAARHMSNVQLVGRNRSATDRAIAVMGPQVGYFYPEILMELDLHGGGIDARGATFPGTSLYVELGRGKKYAWSATSSGSDNVDQFLEQLCNPNGSPPTRSSDHYMFNGRCLAMTHFDAGRLNGEPVSFNETVHGPVSGTATVGGKPYAITTKRSTRGREAMNAFAFADLNTNKVHGARHFADVMKQVEFTFNWFYVDAKHTAFFSSGRLPIRAKGTDPSLPTLGTGEFEWRGFLARGDHPHAVDPLGDLLLNWNNKPAPEFGAADDNWNYGAVDHVQLFSGFKARDNRIEDVVSIMNRAATQDADGVLLWPIIARVLATGPAPDALTKKAAELIDAWVAHGASRLDRDNNGLIDDPGAAVLIYSLFGIETAALRPVLGDLASQIPADLASYVSKDLRTLLGEPVAGPYSRKYCGNGNLTACRNALWEALQGGARYLESTQGSDPTKWRAVAGRITFAPGILPNTMRETNRPTFQQVVEFDRPK